MSNKVKDILTFSTLLGNAPKPPQPKKGRTVDTNRGISVHSAKKALYKAIPKDKIKINIIGNEFLEIKCRGSHSLFIIDSKEYPYVFDGKHYSTIEEIITLLK